MNPIECCGCTACEHICPVNAIKMVKDSEGFSYPYTDMEKCVHCNKCIDVCAFKKAKMIRRTAAFKQKIIAVKNKNESIRLSSSSGGVFSLLAEAALSEDKSVYGAAFNDQFEVVHERADQVEECVKFRGAKYVQSNLTDTFREIGLALKTHKGVLFSGTPCQVAGLQSYLQNARIDLSDLITIDIVCHGVPSPKVWKDYLAEVAKSDRISSVSFRDKRNGWHHSELVIQGDNIFVSQNHGMNPYSLLYFSHFTMRPSCSICPYSNLNRVGDITIGDFWNIEKTHPEIDDDKGISLVMINTDKGESLYHKIQAHLIVIESNSEECLQPNLIQPSTLASNRSDFWKIYKSKGIKHAIKMFTFYGDSSIIIKMERQFLRLKNKAKRVFNKS